MPDDDTKRGLYEKFDVYRTDGGSAEGGKHQYCDYFVLDLVHDEFAIPALRAYAEACREAFPELADQLGDVVESAQPDAAFGALIAVDTEREMSSKHADSPAAADDEAVDEAEGSAARDDNPPGDPEE